MALQPGTLLKERYLIENQLGKGGMGAVYLAHDQALRIKVAVKENLNLNPESERQFRREAELLAALRHPNLPRVSDHFILEERQYLVMDYIAGEDLHARSHRQPPSVEEVLEWADVVCNALSFLHSREPPIIHRDIKPANLKLQPDGTVILVDFGIAKEFDQAVTTTGARGLTPGFSPPEQYGAQRTDARSDQFSLSATIYCLLTGQRPADSIERSIKKAELIPPSTLNPSVPAHVDTALIRALSMDKDARFPDVASFRAALYGEIEPATVLEAALPQPYPSSDDVETVLEPSPTSTSPDMQADIHSVQEPALHAERPRQRRGRILGAAVLGVAIIGVGAAIAIRAGLTPSPPEPFPSSGGDNQDEPQLAIGDFMVVTDDYEVLEIEIPNWWTDIDGTPWYFEGELVGASIWASPDLEGFTSTWSIPGVVFDVSNDITEQASHIELLEIRRTDMLDYCELDRRYNYEDERYRGKYDLFKQCGGPDGPWYMILSAVSQAIQFPNLILVEAQIVSDQDWDITQHVLDTYMMVGEMP